VTELGALLNGTLGPVLAGLLFTALVVAATLLLTARSDR
jgi:hypothetical protein